jgi:hypothetical protein
VIRNSGNEQKKVEEEPVLTEKKKNDRNVGRGTSLCLLPDIYMRQRNFNSGTRNCRTRLKI